MNADFLRHLDFWVGRPICFLLSIIDKFQRILSGRSKSLFPKKLEKIMFLELSEMGSAILSIPAMKMTKKMHPDAELYFWIFRRNRESVDLAGIIPKNNVITLRDDNLILLTYDLIKNIYFLHKLRLDAIVDLELFSRFSSILCFLSGAKIRAGFHRYTSEGLYRGNLHTHIAPYNCYMHISDNFLSLVYLLADRNSDKGAFRQKKSDLVRYMEKIESSKSAKANMWNRLMAANDLIDKGKKLVVISHGASRFLPVRKWPEKNYVELIQKLTIDENIFIVLIGLNNDKPAANKIMRTVNNNQCVNLTGNTTLSELIDLYNISTLLISHDGGPPHFAALTNINSIVLFGPETPATYAPLETNLTVIYADLACSPCVSAFNHRKTYCKNNKCLQAITAEEVYQAALTYLSP